jgi:4-amino-4-deoxy-L-arabinose transferase-like glycosyltransferase
VTPATPYAGATRLWWFYAAAAATFLPAIGFYYVGEEAIFPIASLEMWYHGEWVRQLLYGASLQHNPLLNWLIIPLASLAGWEHALVVTRAITIGATVATGLTLAWLCHALYRDAAFAAFAALAYLTLADVLLYRGWLAYADPLFAFFVFAAVACLWVACLRESTLLLAAAVAALTCAFMTKALTAYVFYGVAAAVLAASEPRHRRYLLSPASLLLHAAAVALPLAWLYFVPGNVGQGGRMLGEVLAKLAPESVAEYAAKLVLYPLDAAARLAPALFVAAYYGWRRRARTPALSDVHARIALWIGLVNFAPYWLAPHSAIRYLMPLYPLAALVLARALWSAGPHAARVAQRWLVAALAVKLAVVLAVFPWYQKHYRGENYAAAARQIAERTAGHPLYANNVSASGLSITAHLDVLRLPAAPLTFPPAQWDSGFVINYTPDPALGEVAERYRLGGNDLYLLCRGAACRRRR